jgi:tetraprenyl-beta-curcumene synthase
MAGGALADHHLVARAGLALVVANVRYWTSVAPVVRAELQRWELRAQAIEDPELRALALEKLHDEGFHAEAAAMLATLAPRSYRSDAVEAIVALELLFDYLDGLTERPSADPLGDGELLFGALVNAVALVPTGTREPFEKPELNDNGYLEGLSRAVVVALARLPAAPAITEIAQRIAARSGQAQTRMHAAAQLGTEQLEQWGTAEAQGTGLGWREVLAGAASSVLVLHALIAAAADPDTTREDAIETASAYLSACTMLTLLDGLVDHDEDKLSDDESRLGYIDLYEDPDELSLALTDATQRAACQVRALRNGPHHAMTLVGVVAYYTSAPGARGTLAAPVVARLQAQLKPLISPTLVLVRGWRLAKRVGNRRTPPIGGLASSMRESRRRGGCNEI